MTRAKCPAGHVLGEKDVVENGRHHSVYWCASCKAAFKRGFRDVVDVARHLKGSPAARRKAIEKGMPPGALVVSYLNEEHTGFSDAMIAEHLDLMNEVEDLLKADRERAAAATEGS